MTRKQTDYKKLIGMIGGEYYFLDYIFDDGLMNNKPFKGATATILSPVSKEQYEYRTSKEGMLEMGWDDLWRQAVEAGNVEESLNDWLDDVIYHDGDETVFDFSGYDYWDQLRDLGMNEEEYPVFDCSGGGRSFDKNMKWDKLYNKKLWGVIKQYES